MQLLLVVVWVYLCVLHVLLLFDLWEDLGETCVVVAVEETLVASIDDAFRLLFEFFLWHAASLGFEYSFKEVAHHGF